MGNKIMRFLIAGFITVFVQSISIENSNCEDLNVQNLIDFNIERYRHWDNENLSEYLKRVDEDVTVSIYVKQNKIAQLNGLKEYEEYFADILKTFQQRNVWGNHRCIKENVRITRQNDSVTINIPYKMFERSKSDVNNEYSWKSNGCYVNKWSCDGSQWLLKNYEIYVEETSN